MPAPPLESLPAIVRAVRIGQSWGHDAQRDVRRRLSEDEEELKRRHGLPFQQPQAGGCGGLDDRLWIDSFVGARVLVRRPQARSRRRRDTPAASAISPTFFRSVMTCDGSVGFFHFVIRVDDQDGVDVARELRIACGALHGT